MIQSIKIKTTLKYYTHRCSPACFQKAVYRTCFEIKWQMGIFIKDKLVIIKKNKVRTLQSRRKELDRGKQREMAFGQKWSKSLCSDMHKA